MSMRAGLYAILLSTTIFTTIGLSGGSVAQTVYPTSDTLKDAINNLDNGTTTTETVVLSGNTNTYDSDTPDGYRVTKGDLTIYQDPDNRGTINGSLGIDGPSSANKASLTLYGIGSANVDWSAGTASDVAGYWTNLQSGQTTATDPALLATNADLSITGVVFANSNNTTTDTVYGNGGAIKMNENTTATIQESLFYNNKTQKYGGAIDVDNDAAVITQLQDTAFINNSAAIHGGALDVDGVVQNMDGNMFAGNTSEDGGAIYVDGGSVSGSANVFQNNTATGDGGAIYVGVDTGDGVTPSTQAGSATLTGTTFTGNSAINGGALYNTGGTATISGGSFTGNTASGQGGAIYSAGTTNVTGSTISGNTANSGAGIYNASGNMTLSDVTVSDSLL